MINGMDKKSFDMEYATQYRREADFLAASGIDPTFVKRDKATGVRTYKYTKTPDLFAALLRFYKLKAGQDGANIFDELQDMTEVDIPDGFELPNFIPYPLGVVK